MMNRICLSALLGLLTLGLSAGNPLGMPEYSQTLRVTFKTPEEARKAELKKLELPGGKKLAFSTRWDDTNNRHLKMAQTLAAQGYKGTFYLYDFLNEQSDRTVPAEILKLGSSLGSHTVDHQDLPGLLPAGIFYQILEQRIREEAAYDTCVTAFVLPYTSCSTRFRDHVSHLIGDILKRSGHFGGPEPWGDAAGRYGLGQNEWFGSFMFGINDRNPSPELFEKGVARGLKNLKTPDWKGGPHLTLGLHTWQSDDGFRVLDGILKQHGNNPDWWYCNENEYLAYRYQFFHTNIRKKSVDGSTAVFEITRIAAPELGHDIPLTVQTGGDAVSAMLNSRPLPVSTNGIFALPHDDNRKIPVAVELVRFTGATPAPARLTELSGTVQMAFREQENRIDFSLIPADPAGKFENVSLILRLPPAWKEGVRRMIPPSAAGKISASFPLGVRDPRPGFRDGDYHFYLQADLLCNGVPKRLHAVMTIRRETGRTASPRDNALAVGPLPAGTFTPELLARLSMPSAPLNGFGAKSIEKWHPVLSGDRAAPSLSPVSADESWKPEAEEFRKKQKGEFAFALEFDSPAAEPYNLLLNLWNADQISAIYINGKPYKFKRPCPFVSVAGRNRVVLVYPVAKNRTPATQMVSVARGDNMFDHVKFLPVDNAR